MVKVTCDRCGKKIKNPKVETKYSMCVYTTPLKLKRVSIDLCPDCQKELVDYMDKAESYFINNKNNAIDIFEMSKFYRD